METTKQSIPIAKPFLAKEEFELVQTALASGWISQGPLVAQFEEDVCRIVQAKYGIATTSCTTALHLAMLIHDIGQGDDVICPSFSFIATANGIAHAGASPQFCDIDPQTMNISPDECRTIIEENYDSDLKNKKTGNKLKAVLIVHQIGIPADVDAFNQIADDFGIIVLEDSACSIGSFYKGKPVGSSGNTSAWSFHPRKVITTGEGGMITLEDKDRAERARRLRAHGASISAHLRHQSASTMYEEYDEIAYNYRMTDMQAAIGIKQLERLDWIVSRRNEIALHYNSTFDQAKGIKRIKPKDYVTTWNYQSYPVILENASRDERDEVISKLDKVGIATRRGIPPIHKEGAYNKTSGKGLILPYTERLSETVVFLPIFPSMTEDEVSYVAAEVKSVIS